MVQISKHIKIEEQGDNSTIIYTNKDGSTVDLKFTKGAIQLTGASMGVDMLGVDPTPVVRANNPIVGINDVNENIDALDAAIGVTNTPIVRTNHPTLTTNSVNLNINALDACIGTDGDITPVTRTVGQVVVDSTVNAKFEMLDTVIGFDAQMSGTPTTISKSNSIYQNLEALGAYKSIRTVKVTVGNVGVTADKNFLASAGTHEEQFIDLGEIIPAKARIVDVMVVTDAAFTNLGSLATDVGLTTGAGDLIAVVDNTAINTIMYTPVAGAFMLAPIITAQHVWLNCDPANNWDSASPVGKMSVYVTFIDVTNI